MTLILGIVTPNGFWLSSDYRLTNPTTGRIVHDWSPKSITLTCPDGIGMITYCGLGKIGGVHTSVWLSQILEGKQRTLDESVQHICLSATAMFRRLGWTTKSYYQHLFLVAAFVRGQPWIAEITNAAPNEWMTTRPPNTQFEVASAQQIDKPIAIMIGVRDAVRPGDKLLLLKARDRRPRRPSEYLRLLATINRRAWKATGAGAYISAACETTWLPRPPEPFEKWIFLWDKVAPTNVKAFRHVALGVNVLPITSDFVAGLSLPVDLMAGARDLLAVEKIRSRRMLRSTR